MGKTMVHNTKLGLRELSTFSSLSIICALVFVCISSDLDGLSFEVSQISLRYLSPWSPFQAMVAALINMLCYQGKEYSKTTR